MPGIESRRSESCACVDGIHCRARCQRDSPEAVARPDLRPARKQGARSQSRIVASRANLSLAIAPNATTVARGGTSASCSLDACIAGKNVAELVALLHPTQRSSGSGLCVTALATVGCIPRKLDLSAPSQPAPPAMARAMIASTTWLLASA